MRAIGHAYPFRDMRLDSPSTYGIKLAPSCRRTSLALLETVIRARRHVEALEKECMMLMPLFVILLMMWLLGMVSSYTLDGFIHILLFVALVVVLIRIIEGRQPF